MPFPPRSVPVLCTLAFACSDYALNENADVVQPPAPDILVEPTSIHFGDDFVGCDSDTSVHVTNVGEAPLSVTGIEIEGDVGFFTDNLSIELAVGESAVFNMSYQRDEVGGGRAYIDVLSNDPDDPRTQVAAVGETVLQPRAAESFVQLVDPVDVLWVIDNSSSMGEEQARVIAEINAFYAWFETLALDYHMGVVTTDIVTPSLSGRLVGAPAYIDAATANGEAELAESLNVGTDDQGNESGLAAAQLALSEPLLSAENTGFYRPEARLVVAFLSDEPEQSTPEAAAYIEFFTNLKADPSRVVIAAIVGDYGAGCQNTCDGTAQSALPGDKYLDVVYAFGGVFGSICTCDLSPTLDAIGLASTIFGRTFPLAQVPSDPAGLQAWIDGTESTSFTYDTAANSIVFDSAPRNGAVVDVEYDLPVVCIE